MLLLSSHSVVSSSFATPGTVALQAPLSMGFPSQEYGSGLLFPSPTGSSWLRDRTQVSCISRQILYHWPLGKPVHFIKFILKLNQKIFFFFFRTMLILRRTIIKLRKIQGKKQDAWSVFLWGLKANIRYLIPLTVTDHEAKWWFMKTVLRGNRIFFIRWSLQFLVFGDLHFLFGDILYNIKMCILYILYICV